jgi:hypothetical protein
MLSFTSLDDLKQLPSTDPAYSHVQRLIETCLSHEDYDPAAAARDTSSPSDRNRR